MRVLALDIGSSSIKAALWNGRRFISHSRVPYKTIFDGPRVEINPEVLRKAVLAASLKILAQSKRPPDAISFCTFSPSLIITDSRGQPRSPIITHADRRSTEIAAQLVHTHGQSAWLKHAGNLPYPGSIAASTLAFLKRSPDHRALFKGDYRIGQLSSLITCTLTFDSKHAKPNPWIIDPSQAAFLGLYDIHTHTWNEALCRAIHIRPEALPRIAPADSILGTLGPHAAKLLHLPTGIPIIGGFVDTSAAVIQTPMQPGQLAHSAGSTDVLAMCLSKPAPAEGILTRPVGVSEHFPDRWLAVRTIAAAGSALQWAKETFFRELTDPQWQHLTKKIAHSPGFPSGAAAPLTNLPHCQPTFAGERASITQPQGEAFSNLHLSTTREELLESLIRALANQSAANYQILKKIHTPAKTIYAMGGASTLADAMHANWPNHHTFHQLKGDSLRGLVLLAQHTLKLKI